MGHSDSFMFDIIFYVIHTMYSLMYSVQLEWKFFFSYALGSSNLKSILLTYHTEIEFLSFWVTFVHVPRIWVKPNPSKIPKTHHAAWSILTRPHTEPPLPLLHTEVQVRQKKYQIQVSKQNNLYLIEMPQGCHNIANTVTKLHAVIRWQLVSKWKEMIGIYIECLTL